MPNIVKNSLDLLGLEVKDKVTDFQGIVATISFDLYGCIQAVVTPKMTTPAELKDSRWFDVSRLKIISHVPIMDRPTFLEDKHGGFVKSLPHGV